MRQGLYEVRALHGAGGQNSVLSAEPSESLQWHLLKVCGGEAHTAQMLCRTLLTSTFRAVGHRAYARSGSRCCRCAYHISWHCRACGLARGVVRQRGESSHEVVALHGIVRRHLVLAAEAAEFLQRLLAKVINREAQSHCRRQCCSHSVRGLDGRTCCLGLDWRACSLGHRGVSCGFLHLRRLARSRGQRRQSLHKILALHGAGGQHAVLHAQAAQSLHGHLGQLLDCEAHASKMVVGSTHGCRIELCRCGHWRGQRLSRSFRRIDRS
mmetsp:Transcript_91214/g.167332  ORF Transcript_91214/g.167332 Transcript_91214/m.167332 type:complete len:268 (+) Transcript_91214:752-1555(+)